MKPGGKPFSRPITPVRAAEFTGRHDVDSLERLVVYSQRQHGQAYQVARFLLHLHDPQTTVDLTRLLSGDRDVAVDCIAVMKMRFDNGIEPHIYFVNGDAIFSALWKIIYPSTKSDDNDDDVHK